MSILILLILVISSSLIYSQYYFNNKLAIKATNTTFKIISNNISKAIVEKNIKVIKILNANLDNTNLYKEINFQTQHPALEDLTKLATINKNIYAIYFTHKDGSFYEIINMKESKLLYQTYKAPENTRWTVFVSINNKAEYTFLDQDRKIISTRTVDKKYDPLIRPWYKNAINSDTAIITEPYLFTNINESGSTFAIELNQKGTVFAIDYTMKSLQKVLKLQKYEDSSEIFLFNTHGDKLISSNDIKEDKQNLDITNSNTIEFTPQEESYIKNTPPLIISNMKDWMPFDFQSNGIPMGYSVDLMKLLAKKSDLEIEFVNALTKKEIIESFKDEKIDIVQSIYKTPQRENFAIFSDPVYEFKNYFISHKDTGEIHSISQLNSKKVAVVKGSIIETYLKKQYPEVEIVLYDDLTSSILALSKKEVYATIETKEAFRFLNKHLNIDKLVIGDWFGKLDGYRPQSIHFMLHNDNPTLLSIVNKTINSITTEEKNKLKQKWLSANSKSKYTIDSQLMEAFSKGNKDVIRYDIDNKNYFALYKSLGLNHTYLGIKLDSEILFNPYNESMKYSFTISLILFFLSLVIIIYVTKIIIQPIKDLIAENEHVKNRKFKKVKTIDTNILEFMELSNSLVSMSQSIHEYQKAQEELIDSIIKIVAEAVDAKSPYTGGHCARVPEIAQLLVDAASKSNKGIFKEFSLESEDEIREFEIGAWLHDCGKVTTPEYVVDKATKLETIYNRIHEIRTRFEVLWRDAQIDYLEAKLNNEDIELALETLNAKKSKLIDDFEFIANANIGGEFMSDDSIQRVKDIAQQEWQRNFDDTLGISKIEDLRYGKKFVENLPVTEKLLSDKIQHIVKRDNFDYEAYEKAGFKEEVPKELYNYGEIYNLCITKGTLTPEERYKIDEHIILTIKMLEKIPFPSHMTKIPEYAGTHHETLIGTGYPRKLTKDQLSIPSRIMALADVFEALTASDRPYRKANPLSHAIKILSFMVKDEHIDGDVFKLFLESGLYMTYAKQYLRPEQIDEVDIKEYL